MLGKKKKYREDLELITEDEDIDILDLNDEYYESDDYYDDYEESDEYDDSDDYYDDEYDDSDEYYDDEYYDDDSDEYEDDYEDRRAGRRRSKKDRKRDRSVNREFAVVTYIFLAIFIGLAAYFVFFLGWQSEDFINSAYNPRLAAISEDIIRGNIMTSDGIVVARTETDDDGNESRVYPYDELYAHVVGYSVNGMAGAELDANFNLLKSHSLPLETIYNDIMGNKNQGDTAVLTIDSSIQQMAYYGLGDYNGAVIALDPETGEILAMVSKPDYNPNTIAEDWESITSDSSSSVLLNRAIQGLYPPGSTFKIVTLLEYLHEGGTAFDQFDCEGTYTYEDKTIHCYKSTAHGEQSLALAFGNSCNVAFSQVGLTLDISKWQDLCDSLLFNQTLPTRLSNVKKSSFAIETNADTSEIMETAIGQGQTLVTPMHMAMIVSAIANDGVLMEPYYIDHMQNDQNFIVEQYESDEYGSLMASEDAELLQGYMRYVVTDGNCSKLDVDTYTAYGKTGTAEYNSNKDDNHSWFVGYAENNGKKLVVAVIMEGAGSGSAHALPVAKTIFDAYFE